MAVAAEFSDTVAIVTRDRGVVDWALARDLGVVEDPGEGLSTAARIASEWAFGRSKPWLILHSDLPWLTRPDLVALWEARPDNGFVLASSYDGGTPAIGGTEPFEFSYGPASFHRHLAAVARSAHAVIHRRGLAIDIDLPQDLSVAMDAEPLHWLQPLQSNGHDGLLPRR